MLYINPCYVSMFDTCNSSSFTETTINNKKCFGSDSSNINFCCVKNVDSNKIWMKCSMVRHSYNLGGLSVIVNDADKQYIVYILEINNNGNNALVKGSFPYNLWEAMSFCFSFVENLDGKKVLSVTGKLYGNDVDVKGTTTYSNPKLVGISFYGSFFATDVVISDMPVYENDNVIELGVSYSGDFVENENKGHDLANVGKSGLISVDTSSIKTDGYSLAGVCYESIIKRNNEDINAVEIDCNGEKSNHSLNDGSNFISLSFNDIKKDDIGAMTITAKKV